MSTRKVRVFTIEECPIGQTLIKLLPIPDDYLDGVGCYMYNSEHKEHCKLFERIPEGVDNDDPVVQQGLDVVRTIFHAALSDAPMRWGRYVEAIVPDGDYPDDNWQYGYNIKANTQEMTESFETDGFEVVRARDELPDDINTTMAVGALRYLSYNESDKAWPFLRLWLEGPDCLDPLRVAQETIKTLPKPDDSVLLELANIVKPDTEMATRLILAYHGYKLKDGELVTHPLVLEAEDPSTSTTKLRELYDRFKEENPTITKALARNPSLPEDMVELLAENHVNEIVDELLVNPAFQTAAQNKRRAWIDRRCCMASYVTTEEAMNVLLKDPSFEVRRALAWNSSAPPQILDRLAYDKNDEVRLAVAGNGSTAYVSLRKLSEETHQDIRATARDHYKFEQNEY